MTSIPKCSFAECDKAVVVKSLGLCDGHYRQAHRGAELTPLKQWAKPRVGCAFFGCKNPHNAKGLCGGHYQQLLAGVELTPLQSYAPGEWSDWAARKSGYIFRHRRLNGVTEVQAQHRYVMEQHLKRPLLAHETVHHKNGQRGDNRLENLELWSTTQPAGQRVEDKIAWMKAFLEQYGYLVIEAEAFDS